ncbi:OmpA family protein [Spongiivirga sp. MCCC 1A20706]|uniref:OmpA family protein n=1 Tax=Spongiivirga sp. MCCC 1A20706 TaxID=3160963 RepID=UPI00397770EE
MKPRYKTMNYILSLALVFSVTTGCKTANNTQKGAVIGTAGGAVLGGVIGNNVGKGNTVLGAIIGGVVGGAAGAYIGNRMDRQAERIETEIPGAEVERVGEGISITFDERSGVYFDTNKSNINSKSAATLQKLAGIFKEYPNSNILIEGHTDNTGSDEYNMTLSKKRALSVSDYLAEKGVNSSRFTTKWYGEDQPQHDNSTAEGRSKNRRVAIAVVANERLKQEAVQKTKG